MDISASWPNGSAPGDSSSQPGQTNIFTGNSDDLPSLANFSDDAALDYLNHWDDIEM